MMIMFTGPLFSVLSMSARLVKSLLILYSCLLFSLCSVIPPEEKEGMSRYRVTFIMHLTSAIGLVRRKTFILD